MRKLSGFFLGFIVLVAMAASASASTINYTTTGTLTYVSGVDKLSLDGNALTLTNSLNTNQVPVTTTILLDGGIQEVYNTQVTIVLPLLTLTSTSAQITLVWYPHPTVTEKDSIGLNAAASVFGVSSTFTSFVPITIPGATPSALLNTPLPSGSVVTAVAGNLENATFTISGTIQGVGPSGVPEPGTITMLSGGLVLVAGSFLRKRFLVKRS